MPFLPVIAIHYWSSRHPDRLSAWVPFLAGLVVDVLSNGPLGYFSLLYLGSSLLGAEAGSVLAASAAGRWAQFIAALMALVLVGWGVACLYELAIADWRPFAWALWLAALSYPVIAVELNELDPAPHRLSNDRLVRGI